MIRVTEKIMRRLPQFKDFESHIGMPSKIEAISNVREALLSRLESSRKEVKNNDLKETVDRLTETLKRFPEKPKREPERSASFSTPSRPQSAGSQPLVADASSALSSNQPFSRSPELGDRKQPTSKSALPTICLYDIFQVLEMLHTLIYSNSNDPVARKIRAQLVKTLHLDISPFKTQTNITDEKNYRALRHWFMELLSTIKLKSDTTPDSAIIKTETIRLQQIRSELKQKIGDIVSPDAVKRYCQSIKKEISNDIRSLQDSIKEGSGEQKSKPLTFSKEIDPQQYTAEAILRLTATAKYPAANTPSTNKSPERRQETQTSPNHGDSKRDKAEHQAPNIAITDQLKNKAVAYLDKLREALTIDLTNLSVGRPGKPPEKKEDKQRRRKDYIQAVEGYKETLDQGKLLSTESINTIKRLIEKITSTQQSLKVSKRGFTQCHNLLSKLRKQENLKKNYFVTIEAVFTPSHETSFFSFGLQKKRPSSDELTNFMTSQYDIHHELSVTEQYFGEIIGLQRTIRDLEKSLVEKQEENQKAIKSTNFKTEFKALVESIKSLIEVHNGLLTAKRVLHKKLPQTWRRLKQNISALVTQFKSDTSKFKEFHKKATALIKEFQKNLDIFQKVMKKYKADKNPLQSEERKAVVATQQSIYKALEDVFNIINQSCDALFKTYKQAESFQQAGKTLQAILSRKQELVSVLGLINSLNSNTNTKRNGIIESIEKRVGTLQTRLDAERENYKSIVQLSEEILKDELTIDSVVTHTNDLLERFSNQENQSFSRLTALCQRASKKGFRRITSFIEANIKEFESRYHSFSESLKKSVNRDTDEIIKQLEELQKQVEEWNNKLPHTIKKVNDANGVTFGTRLFRLLERVKITVTEAQLKKFERKYQSLSEQLGKSDAENITKVSERLTALQESVKKFKVPVGCENHDNFQQRLNTLQEQLTKTIGSEADNSKTLEHIKELKECLREIRKEKSAANIVPTLISTHFPSNSVNVETLSQSSSKLQLTVTTIINEIKDETRALLQRQLETAIKGFNRSNQNLFQYTEKFSNKIEQLFNSIPKEFRHEDESVEKYKDLFEKAMAQYVQGTYTESLQPQIQKLMKLLDAKIKELDELVKVNSCWQNQAVQEAIPTIRGSFENYKSNLSSLKADTKIMNTTTLLKKNGSFKDIELNIKNFCHGQSGTLDNSRTMVRAFVDAVRYFFRVIIFFFISKCVSSPRLTNPNSRYWQARSILQQTQNDINQLQNNHQRGSGVFQPVNENGTINRDSEEEVPTCCTC